MRSLGAIASVLQQRIGAQEALRARLDESERACEEAMLRGLIADEGVDWLAAIYETHRKGFEEQIGEVVSKGLSDVFGESLTMRAVLGQSGDVPTIAFRIADDSGVETDVMDARSGGYINVIAFLLQARVLLAVRPPLARLMILDECFSNIHESLYPMVAALLSAMVKDGGFQLIIITQNARLADALSEIGEVNVYTKTGGKTTITKAAGSQVPATLP